MTATSDTTKFVTTARSRAEHSVDTAITEMLTQPPPEEGKRPASSEDAPADLAAACAWATAHYKSMSVRARTEKWDDARLDAEMKRYDQAFRRAVEEPSASASDIRAKAKMLLADLKENDDPNHADLSDDERLMRVVLREIAASAGGDRDDEAADEPLTVESAATIDFEAFEFDEPVKLPAEWVNSFSVHSMGLHVADRTLRMTKPELVEFIREAGLKNPITPEAMHNALDTAQETLGGWSDLLSLARDRYMVAASAQLVQDEPRQVQKTEA